MGLIEMRYFDSYEIAVDVDVSLSPTEETRTAYFGLVGRIPLCTPW